jgi:xanthine dehydrogenase accessory factor
VAVLAHDEKLDVPALRAALRANAATSDCWGARARAGAARALQAAGFAPADVARIRGPIGLKSIGALEPAEIAVSILAELIMARRGKRGAGRKGQAMNLVEKCCR